MAKTDGAQRKPGAAARVYKSKDVHRRRVGKRARADERDSEREELAEPTMPEAFESPESSVMVEGPERDVDGTRGEEPFEVMRSQSVEADEQESASSARSGIAGRVGALFAKRTDSAPDGSAQDDGAPADGAPDEDTLASDMLADEDVSSSEHADGEGSGPSFKMPAKKRKFKLRGPALALLLIVLIVVVGVSAAFAWNRWGRFDDHADMQGQWYVLGTTVPVTIDAQSIHLTDDISYEYEIDDHAKTIRYTFGPMQGEGRYWFSDDRRFFAITDGEGYTGATTVFEDIAHSFAAEKGATGAKLPEGEGVIVLGREPGWLVTVVQEAADRAKERVQAQKTQEKAEAEKKAAEEKAKAAEKEAAQQAGEAGGQDAVEGEEEYYEDADVVDSDADSLDVEDEDATADVDSGEEDEEVEGSDESSAEEDEESNQEEANAE